jgi:LPS sulfotransferase NodH
MLRGGRPGSHGRFLVIGRARSGTTLLTRLLNAVQGVHCDGEVLHHAVLDPRGHLNRLARVSDAPIYGCKLLSYQMHEVLRLRDPHGFLARAKADGFQLIHMRRHTLDQCLSLSVAQTTKAYVSDRAAQAEAPRRLNPADFVAQVRWNEALLAYETAALAGLNPLVVDYERDLRDAAMHAATVGRICGLFDLAPHKIAPAAIRKQLGGGLDQVIDNADEIRAALRAAGLGAVLDAQDQAGPSNTQT